MKYSHPTTNLGVTKKEGQEREDAHCELFLQCLKCQEPLHHIGAVQTVHAVGAEHPALLHQHCAISLLLEVPVSA